MDLIRKLAVLAGPSYQKELTPQILVSELIKAPNKQVLLSVQAIRRAIDHNRQITFKYLHYYMDKQLVPKYAGTLGRTTSYPPMRPSIITTGIIW